MSAVGQESGARVVTTGGQGTIKLGKEEFKLHAVVVKLFEDGKAEFHLITDMTVFVSGTWARGSDGAKGIDIKITGNVVGGNMEGGGKLSFSEDLKSVRSLKLNVVNKTSRRAIQVDFTAKQD
ncbi:MAG TPA: hypothetical protein VJV03_19430 [Pyrinomonadaceae bacterium]|nr:hypothetical protein [Pyrinomonadaceae bacterium]